MLEKLGKEPREPEKVIAALDLQEKPLVIPRPFQFLQKVEMIGEIDSGVPFPPLRQRLAMGVTGQDARDIVAHERVMDARPVKVFPHQDKEIQFRSDAQGTRASTTAWKTLSSSSKRSKFSESRKIPSNPPRSSRSAVQFGPGNRKSRGWSRSRRF